MRWPPRRDEVAAAAWASDPGIFQPGGHAGEPEAVMLPELEPELVVVQ